MGGERLTGGQVVLTEMLVTVFRGGRQIIERLRYGHALQYRLPGR